MKKLILAISFASSILIIASFKKSNNNVQNSPGFTKSPLTQTRVTLNGIPYGKADTMVKTFLNNKGSYNSIQPTSVWFSKATFHGMDSLLKVQGSDGLRIYFAKKADSTNAIIVVSTFNGGTPAENKYVTVHKDFFQLPGDELYSKNTDINGMVGYGVADGGARLHTNNPGCLAPGKDGCDPRKPHYITCQRAFDMVNKYGSDPINATSEWYDAGIINDLDSSLNAQNGDGIRIYFARHIDPDMSEATDTVHRHGFVLITTQLLNGVHQDYFDCFLTHPIYQPKIEAEKMLVIKGGIPIRIEGGTDNGEQCPDNCYGVTWP